MCFACTGDAIFGTFQYRVASALKIVRVASLTQATKQLKIFAEKSRKKFKCGLASVVGSFVSTRFLILQQLFRENETLTKGAEIRHRAQ